MQIEKYVDEMYNNFWDKTSMEDHEKVDAAPLLTKGYDFIKVKLKKHHKELTPDAVRDAGILEGFLITFIQHGSNKDQLDKIGAIVG